MATQRRNKDIERFDQWAGTYEDSRLQRIFFDRIHEATVALAAGIVDNPGCVLDVGCGTGKLLRRASALWPEAKFFGVDPANGMVEMAKRLTPGATFFTGMAEALPLKEASVDLAMSTTSFHHWQDQAAGIREIARVLRPGGCFILVDASFPEWFVRIFRPKRFHSPAQMRALFTQAGLEIQAQKRLVWGRWLATIGNK
jgi:ubiquinone/menaquinone biosynthesis C-methylase UbiE